MAKRKDDAPDSPQSEDEANRAAQADFERAERIREATAAPLPGSGPPRIDGGKPQPPPSGGDPTVKALGAVQEPPPTQEASTVVREFPGRTEGTPGAPEGQPAEVDPNREPSPGETAANVEILHTKGDLAPMHPANRPPELPPAPPADKTRGKEKVRQFMILRGQVGLHAAARPGQPPTVVGLDQLQIPESSIDRLTSLGVIQEVTDDT